MPSMLHSTSRSPVPLGRRTPPGAHAQRALPLEEHLISGRPADSFETDQYRLLGHFLDQTGEQKGHRILAVTSAGVGDGKTTTAINLATILAQSPKTRVLLVDTDLRRPLVAANLGMVDSGPGLVGALLDARHELASVVRTTPFHLDVLPAGRPPGNPYQVLDSSRVGQLLSEARAAYDCVILDTPPVLVVPDCRLMSQWVDGFLVVVAAHRTPRKLFGETLGALDPGKVLGIVYNRDDRPLSGYYGQYYGSYYRTRPGRQPGGGWWSRLWHGRDRRRPESWR